MQRARTVVLVVVVAALVALAGCSADTQDVEENAPEDTVPLGEAVELDDDDTTIEVTVTEYKLVESYESPYQENDSTYTAEAPGDQQYLFVKVRVENVGSVNGTEPTMAIEPKNDSSSGPGPVWRDDLYYGATQIQPGETHTGWRGVTVNGSVAASDVRVGFSTDAFVSTDEFRWTLEE
jgi:hypothetical protein